jgi:hypothetical protein
MIVTFLLTSALLYEVSPQEFPDIPETNREVGTHISHPQTHNENTEYTVSFSHNYHFAQQPGCCKQRSSTRERWYRNELNFWNCNELNRHLDGDDVYEEKGRVWWDRNC